MKANINLLPWREELRERRKKEFLAFLLGVAVAAVVLVFVGKLVLEAQIDQQNSRNNWLRSEIRDLDGQIAEIRTLRQEREQLLARMRAIQELQGNRPVIVRMFDELVRTNPTGSYYTSVRMDGRVLSTAGTAESNTRISALMRNLDASDWFANPNLRAVRENPAFGPQASNFQMTVSQANPQQQSSDARGG